MVSTPISTTSSITPKLATNQLMNTKVSEDDSLFHICDRLLNRLGQYKPLKPYIESAEMLAEYSSERQEDLFNNTYKSMDNAHTFNNENNNSRPNSTLYRKSSQADSRRASTSSFHSNGVTNSTVNNSSIHSPSVASLHSSDILSVAKNQNIYLVNIESNIQQIPTFSIGSLPPSKSKDPVTTLWKLFQMGAPLCIIFNAIKPQYKINVVSSDDIKVCKKSIYDFISSCKMHLEFHDEELFTISDVFNNGTFTLVKIIEVVLTLISYSIKIFPSLPTTDSSLIKNEPIPDSLKKDERYKIFREFLETERKYVYDLETLQDFNAQLLTQNFITINESTTLFPNITEIIEFQRRFLISLEMNNHLLNMDELRLGSVFINSYNYFKLYELWSIGQTAAIEYISKLPIYSNTSKPHPNADKLIIKNKMELQSFLLKPIQRLCKYPLLIKELYQASSSSSMYYKELELGLEVSKKIASNMNEHQRKLENEIVMKELVIKRVANWRGYDISKFGDLISHDKVIITNNDVDFVDAKIFEISLFEKIIIIFNEVNSQGVIINNDDTSSSNIEGNSSGLKITLKKNKSTLNQKALLEKEGELQQFKINNTHKLDLKGRIMVSTITTLQEHYSSPRSIDIKWESSNEHGNFNLKFKNEDIKDVWASYLSQYLKNNQGSNRMSRPSQRSTSVSSQLSESNSSISVPTTASTPTMKSSLRLSHGKRQQNRNSKLRNISETSQLFEAEHRNISESFKMAIPAKQILVRIQKGADFHSILMANDIKFEQFYTLVLKKLHTDEYLRLKYQDEDMDYVMLEGEDDWEIVKNWIIETNQKILTIFAF
ncbi:unnamed protein product [Hanseniaspora opuntiae]